MTDKSTQPADLLALQRLSDACLSRRLTPDECSEFQAAIESLAAHEVFGYWCEYNERSDGDLRGPDMRREFFKSPPLLNGGRTGFNKAWKVTPLYIAPPQAQAQAGAGDAPLWREWLEHAIATWPDAANALIATASALGPTSPITDEDLAWALAALEAKPFEINSDGGGCAAAGDF